MWLLLALQIAAVQPPNVVLIVADDLGWGDLGAYGQTKIQTPHLDSLAAEGLRFTQFYAGSPVCAPSREVLLTGRHTGHTAITSNLGSGTEHVISTDVVTIAEALSAAGYATGGFGKWAQGDAGTTGTPDRHGFGRWFGFLGQHRAHDHTPGWLWDIDGTGARRVGARGYAHDAFVREAFRFIRENAGRPFFVYLATTVPHPELDAPENMMRRYRTEDGESVFPEIPFAGTDMYSAQDMPRAAYAAMVSWLDRDVGRLRALLESLGLDESTFVMVTSDNGPGSAGGVDPEFFASSGPFRGGKRTLYEAGIRVPLIVSGPGVSPGVTDFPAAAWDLHPTILELAGVSRPSDGVSLAGLLRAGKEPERLRPLYWEVEHGPWWRRREWRAVRFGDWKLVHRTAWFGFGQATELYSVTEDPSEGRSLARMFPDTVAVGVRLMIEAARPLTAR